ncbi:MAG: DEAD/DEAH box helicase family protein [Candidatus Aenigmarchaeota archaeon]|nr:DEAD/DEAH box helicase family protein [Candidatus Aenigmarchaeota archaeon]
MDYVLHPWVNPGAIEKRAYQESVLETAKRGNTLCVLPTGLGKTSIAALLAAHRLEKDMNKKILFLAPTKPLVEQHRRSFAHMLKVGEDELKTITGSDKPEERKELYEKADIIFSTPQTVRNDIKNGLFSLRNFSLCIFDEAHRCVGNYAYTYIAKRYMEQASDPLILALTASPGSHREKINEVKNRLFIDYVEIRTREDQDVRPYIQKLEQDYIEIELPRLIRSVIDYLAAVKNDRIKKLVSWRIINYDKINKTQILKLQQDLAKKKTGFNMAAVSVLAEVLKVDHALILAETQCLASLQSYFYKLKEDKTRAVARLMKDKNFLDAIRHTNELIAEGKEHPKMEKLKELVAEQLKKDKFSHIIVFAQFRDTISEIYKQLQTIYHAAPIEFIGQAKKKGKGLSQKEQTQILNEFRMGFYNVLCASQVAEEGLDVVETNLVIFYEPTPSAIRKIQRTGRTARTQTGKVVILIAKDTRDEAYHWSAHQKERKMKKTLYAMQQQRTLSSVK